MSVGWLDIHLREHEFFPILHRTPRSQVATMRLEPGEEAGAPETHDGSDQVILVLRGEMEARVWEKDDLRSFRGGEGTVLVVPAGRKHHVRSVGDEPLLVFTVYAPPAY